MRSVQAPPSSVPAAKHSKITCFSQGELHPTGYGVAEVAGGHGAVELPWTDVGKASVLQGCRKGDQGHGAEIRHECAEEEKHQQNEQFQSLTDQGSAEGSF
jgi:hypothetical protein